MLEGGTHNPHAPPFDFLAAAYLPLINRMGCLLYTSDAADERSSVDLGGRRIIKKKKHKQQNAKTKQKHREQTRAKVVRS